MKTSSVVSCSQLLVFFRLSDMVKWRLEQYVEVRINMADHAAKDACFDTLICADRIEMKTSMFCQLQQVPNGHGSWLASLAVDAQTTVWEHMQQQQQGLPHSEPTVGSAAAAAARPVRRGSNGIHKSARDVVIDFRASDSQSR